jgi:aspartyl-tRNA(Asn)/glutamyl-tRNA(Gln) amidotransferase subunit C
MASIDADQVTRIAYLARLAIEPADVARYARDLSAILALAEQMNALDTSAVEPLAHPLEAPQRLRADEVSESNRRELYQSIAPSVDAGLYLVPKVIE